MVIYDAIVIGSGVAGMTAAIYLKRAGVNVLVLDKSIPGGQVNTTLEISNYPGFSNIDGPTLAYNISQQVKDNDVEIKYAEVLDIKDNEVKEIITNQGNFYSKKIIIATGRIPRKLGLENENKLMGRGVSWCATCDGAFYRNDEVAVVGGGNSALEEALYLSAIVKKVYILVRGDKFRGDDILVKQLSKKANIEVLFETQIKTLNEKDNKLDSITLSNGITINTKALFIYIGFDPVLTPFKNLNLEVSIDNYIVTDKDNRTNIFGIYACGDIVKKHFYQIATAVSDGAVAALALKEDIDKE